MSTTVPPVYLVDQVTVKPGQGPAFLQAYMERYVPGRRAACSCSGAG